MCRLVENWSNAAKYQQMVLDFVKDSSLKEKDALMEDGTKKLQEYNTKNMLKMSMRSILG